MSQPHDLIAFPLVALAALVAVAVAFLGGELIRRVVVHGVLARFGLWHADVDGGAAPRPRRAAVPPAGPPPAVQPKPPVTR